MMLVPLSFLFKVPFSDEPTEELCKERGEEMAGWLFSTHMTWIYFFLLSNTPETGLSFPSFFLFCHVPIYLPSSPWSSIT